MLYSMLRLELALFSLLEEHRQEDVRLFLLVFPHRCFDPPWIDAIDHIATDLSLHA